MLSPDSLDNKRIRSSIAKNLLSRIKKDVNNEGCYNHLIGNMSDQVKILRAKGWKPRAGFKLSKEAKEKISKIHKGKVLSKETKEKLAKLF